MKVIALSPSINRRIVSSRGSVMLLLLLVSLVTPSGSVMFPDHDETGFCLKSGDPVLPCIVSGAVTWLEAARKNQIHVGEGLLLAPDLGLDELPTIEGDPREATTLLEALDRSLRSRRLLWELDWLFPGLMMVVGRGPESRLFFTLGGRSPPEEKMSTARLMVKRTVLPMLLGVQLKTASLLPLLVAALVLLVKKALVVSKLSLLLSGYGLLQQNDPQQQQQYQRPQYHYYGS